MLDERGKAHYLFDKKSADGQIKKAFRTHSKHTSNSDPADESGPSTSSPRRMKKEPIEVKPEPASDIQEENSTASSTTTATTTTTSKGKGRRQPAKAGTRKRRSRFGNSDSDEDSILFDDDFSGNYSTRAIRDEEDEHGQRKSKRSRRPTAAAIESGLATSGSWHNETEEVDPMCPLPGFVDPITLEQVIKPAISKYGHVMGYDSWTRCLTNWEGKRNICPLTKKALTKRDLGKFKKILCT